MWRTWLTALGLIAIVTGAAPLPALASSGAGR